MPLKSYVFDGVDTWIGASTTNVSITPAPQVNPRDSLVYGTYKPDATTTGPLPGITLIQYGNPSTSTNYLATADNQVIKNLEIWGTVNLGAYTNVTVQNCIIHGTLSRGTDTAHIIASGDNLGGALIVDCKLMGRPVTIPATYNGEDQPDAGTVNGANEWCGGIRGANYTINRTEITNVSDGLTFTKLPGNVTVQGCWIHGGWFNEWDASRGTTPSGAAASASKFYPYSTGTLHYTHVDGIQFAIGKDFTIVGNMIGGQRIGGDHNASPSDKDQINSGDEMYNSGMLIKQEVNNTTANKIENVLVDRNWFAGGSATLNITYGNDNDFTSVTVSNNRFIRSPNAVSTHYDVLRSRNTTTLEPVGIFTNNVYDDDGTDVIITRGN